MNKSLLLLLSIVTTGITFACSDTEISDHFFYQILNQLAAYHPQNEKLKWILNCIENCPEGSKSELLQGMEVAAQELQDPYSKISQKRRNSDTEILLNYVVETLGLDDKGSWPEQPTKSNLPYRLLPSSIAVLGFIKNNKTAFNAVAYTAFAAATVGLVVLIYKKMRVKKVCPNCLEQV